MAHDGGVLPFGMDAGGRRSAMRGRLARLDGVAGAILARHGYPGAVAELAAEAIALAACLATTMSFDGVFTLQARGNGPLRTLLADVTSEGAVRGYAHADGQADLPEGAGAPAPFMELTGGGHLAFTVDQGAKGRHQGIVPIEEGDLAGVSTRYFRDSEQIDTELLLAAAPDGAEGWRAAALLLQRIPEEGGAGGAPPASGGEAGAWHTARTLMATCSREELLDPELPGEILLHRLFNEFDLRVSPVRPMRDECRCSPEKVERMLEGLPAGEKGELAGEDGAISIACEFCKKVHRHHVPARSGIQSGI